MARLTTEPISSSERKTITELSVAAFAFSNQTPADRATTLAFYEALGNYREAGEYALRLRALRAEDFSQVAAWYAVEPTWVVLAPKEDKP